MWLIVFLILLALLFGIGAVVKGLFWLAIIAGACLVGAAVVRMIGNDER